MAAPRLRDGFEPESRRRKRITLRLAMELSLTTPELAEYDALSAEEAVERARALTTLHLEWQNFGELSSLEAFEGAETLYAQHNRIERIEGLESLPRLQFLALQGNRISRLENLLCLPRLELLDLSSNHIDELTEQEIPPTVCILKLRGNPCAQAPDYRGRLLARLPALARLDGEDLAASATGPGPKAAADAGRTAAPAGLAVPAAAAEALLATEQGLGAYWKKGEMQACLEESVKELIQAYSIEAMADVEALGGSRRAEAAAARSRARREAAFAVSGRLFAGRAAATAPSGA